MYGWTWKVWKSLLTKQIKKKETKSGDNFFPEEVFFFLFLKDFVSMWNFTTHSLSDISFSNCFPRMEIFYPVLVWVPKPLAGRGRGSRGECFLFLFFFFLFETISQSLHCTLFDFSSACLRCAAWSGEARPVSRRWEFSLWVREIVSVFG